MAPIAPTRCPLRFIRTALPIHARRCREALSWPNHVHRLPAMTDDQLPNGDRFRRGFVLALVIGITAAFLWMVWAFVKTMVLAAILAGLFHPLYRRLYARVGERGWLAAMITVLFVLVVIVVPLALVLGLVASEALRLSTAVAPRVAGARRQPEPAADAAREAAVLRVHRAVPGPDPRPRRRADRQPGPLRRRLDLGHDRRHGLGDPAVLHPALHAVLPAHRRPGAAAQDDQLPAAARGREGAGARQVRVGDAGHAARHAGHRHRPGDARRAVVLGRRHRWRAVLGHR